MVGFLRQLEQAVEKELAWFRATSQGLEKLKVINLDPDVIATQLYEQKVKFLQVSLHMSFIILLKLKMLC